MLETAAGRHVSTHSESEAGLGITGNPGNLGFPGNYRLHAAAEFSKVFAARRVIRGKYFDLHYLAIEPDSESSGATTETRVFPLSRRESRLGLVVAKKLARRAVQRNLFKRLAREAFRQVRAKLPPFDLVLRLTRSPPSDPVIDIRKTCRSDIDQLLERLVRLGQLPASR